MLLDSCYDSYQPYPLPDQYYCSQPSYPPSPLSHPPSPSFYTPSPFSPLSDNVFQFPPISHSDSSSSIKEEPLPWNVSAIEPSNTSSPTQTPIKSSPASSPLLSQTYAPHNASQPYSYLPDTIRYSNSSISSLSSSNTPTYYYQNHLPGTFGHSLGSFHYTSSSNMEFVSNGGPSMVSNTPGSGYSSPSHLTSEVFPSNNAYSQHISVENYAESYPSLSPPATITPMSSMTGEESRDSTKDETGEEQTVLKCRWRECGKVYSDKNMLVEHINSNHIEHRKGCEDYPCHWGSCPRRYKPFNAKYKLLTHIRVHTGEKPFVCKADGCRRSFARLENLKIHTRSHTGEKPFLCKYHTICNKAFSNSSDRAKHEQTHKDPKPYRCDVFGCQKRYTDPSSLRKHVKNHTREEQEQVKQIKDNGRAKHREVREDTWLEIDPVGSTGNLALLSGGGVVTTDVDPLSSMYESPCKRQAEDGGQSYNWRRRDDEMMMMGQRSMRVGEDISHFTPLYLEV